MALTISHGLLPNNAAIDTGVFMRGVLGDEPGEERSILCVEFCNAMIRAGLPLFVAAPTIAEVSRHHGKKVPRFEGLLGIPFDDVAANILGQRMPMAKLHQAKAAGGGSISYLKYDAMILACAIRSRTTVLVTLDPKDHEKLANGLPIKITKPEDYLAKQTILHIVQDPPVAKAMPRAKQKRRR